MPNLILTYFDFPGRAEPIRVALFIAGLPYQDKRLKFPEYAALKEQGVFPLGAVPTFEVDGVTMTQTAAILRYVARVGNTTLYPNDPLAAFVVDSALDTFNDTLSHELTPSLMERDMAKKLEMRAVFKAGPMLKVLQYVEGLAQRFGKPFLGGTDLSIADLVVAQQLLQIRAGGLDGISPEDLDPYPHLNALTDAYVNHPSIVAYQKR
ncbi:MAG: glutathione S-transferase family protein [Myxococcales bacterium]|nr:glutathione S-transferase family protein [Myxococcales bacterium]